LNNFFASPNLGGAFIEIKPRREYERTERAAEIESPEDAHSVSCMDHRWMIGALPSTDQQLGDVLMILGPDDKEFHRRCQMLLYGHGYGAHWHILYT
jgi:hypothetical protein